MKSAPVKQIKHQTLPVFIRRNITTRKEGHVKLPHMAFRPSEETIKKLNELGKQYPFCISFKHKHHDPL